MAEGGTRSLTGEEEAELRAAVAELPAELRLDPARLGAALADVVPFQVDAATIRQLGLADLVVVDGGAARGGPADGSAEATPDRPPRVPMPARVQPRPADVPRHPGRRQLPPSPPVEEADDLDEPPRRASRLRSTSRVLLGASCIALLAVAWFGINHLRDDDGGPTVALPRLVNLSQQSATEQIEALGASAPKIEIVEERTDEGRPGRVLSQDPDAGEPVGSDDTVTLVVAIGADAPVPKVAGSTQAAAIDALAEAQFGTRVTTEPSTKVAEGDVIRTDPKAGTATPTGSVVEVVVSSGAPATEVPAVTGRAFADAVAALERDEFDVDIVLEDSDQPAGTVLRTSPPAGEDAPTGSTVTVVVSAKDEVTTTAPGSATATTAASNGSSGDQAASGGGAATPTTQASSQPSPTVATTQAPAAATTQPQTKTCRTVTDSEGYFDPDSGQWVPAVTHQECT